MQVRQTVLIDRLGVALALWGVFKLYSQSTTITHGGHMSASELGQLLSLGFMWILGMFTGLRTRPYE